MDFLKVVERHLNLIPKVKETQVNSEVGTKIQSKVRKSFEINTEFGPFMVFIFHPKAK